MILISHRGNTNGPNPEMENRPDYINAAANEGYDVEVDVWLINSTWMLGGHVFWHQEDDVTLTSRGFLWTYPGKYLTPHSICVMPERANYETIDCAGVCTDFIKRYES